VARQESPGAPPGDEGHSRCSFVPKFLVNGPDGSPPVERNDVVAGGAEPQDGPAPAITNTVLNFGEGKFSPARKAGPQSAILVGEPHRGLAYMFTMMNEARLRGRVMGGRVAGAYTGYLKSLEYAPANGPAGAVR